MAADARAHLQRGRICLIGERAQTGSPRKDPTENAAYGRMPAGEKG